MYPCIGVADGPASAGPIISPSTGCTIQESWSASPARPDQYLALVDSEVRGRRQGVEARLGVSL